MSQVAISGNASGTGTLTIAAPNTNSNYTLTLPTNTGTIVTNKTAGTVLQVIQSTYNTETTTTSTTFTDTGISASITPSSSTSKILVFYSVGYLNQDVNLGGFQLVRGATVLQSSTRAASRDHASYFHNEYLDSPATTSATTYKVQFNKNTGSAFAICWNSQQPSTMTLMEIAA